MSIFGTELWDGFDSVVKRVWLGKKFCIDLANFTRKKAEIDMEYGKKLQQLSKSFNPLESGTCLSCITGIKNEVETFGKHFIDLAEASNQQVAEPLLAFWKDNKKQRKLLKENGLKLVKDLQIAEQVLQKDKKRYEQLHQTQDKAKEEYEKAAISNNNSKATQALAKKLSKDTQMTDQAEVAYREAVKRLEDIQEKNYESDMIQILEEYGKMEEHRLNCVKQSYLSFSSLFKSLIPKMTEVSNKVEEHAQTMDPNADTLSFVQEKRTGKTKPPRVQFESYNPATGTCGPPDAATAVVPHRSSTVSQPASKDKDDKKRATTSAINSTLRAVAHTFKGDNPHKSPRESDTSKDASETSTSHTTPVTAPVSAPTSTAPNNSSATSASPASITSTLAQEVNDLGSVRCLYDYTPQNPNELAFKAGDIINVLQKHPSGWWQGELNGKVGIFPSVDWVEPLSASSSPSPVAKCRVLYDYKGENEYELSVSTGEILSIYSIDENGWYTGINAAGEVGRFPSNYVETIQE